MIARPPRVGSNELERRKPLHMLPGTPKHTEIAGQAAVSVSKLYVEARGRTERGMYSSDIVVFPLIRTTLLPANYALQQLLAVPRQVHPSVDRTLNSLLAPNCRHPCLRWSLNQLRKFAIRPPGHRRIAVGPRIQL